MREMAEKTGKQQMMKDMQGKESQFNESDILKRPIYQKYSGRLDGRATKGRSSYNKSSHKEQK